ncbi:hypothetical protein AVEN_51286-1 [Araneus ventricosus]|uniref:Secreted protein n=1 Tax=Araneus ventricosus TaxID=182803 RepID=A0A4Y2SXK9_ARAVE|nr:hypothetical protein AVEN_161319-1 [Araneus ventricosus]GBN92026.1 hypothetical protein AVEN_51286-1 [Araneus ventricosus]
MYYATVSHASVFLLLLQRIVALLLPPPQTLLHSLFLCNSMQIYKLFGGQLLAVLFHKLIDIISIHIHLQSPDVGQRYYLVDYRLHRVLTVSELLNVIFDNNLRPKLLPSRSEDSLGNPFPCIFNHF